MSHPISFRRPGHSCVGRGLPMAWVISRISLVKGLVLLPNMQCLISYLLLWLMSKGCGWEANAALQWQLSAYSLASCCSVTQLCPTLCDPMDCSTPGFPVLHCLPEFVHLMFIIESMMPSNHLVLRHPLLLLPSIFPSIRVFSNESTLRIRWPNYWNFNFSISPSKEYSGLISFRIDWFDLLAVQETLKSLLQHHNSKASILWCSAFFMIQLSHPYITTGKIIALTIWLCPQSDVSVF